MHNTRLHLDWYIRRSATNKRIKDFFVGKILAHCPECGMTAQELYFLNYEDLCELAIACVNTSLTITSVAGQDYDDTSDAKVAVSQCRNNNKKSGNWTNSIKISGTKNKIGPLRIVAYNQILDDFYFFYIPYYEFHHHNQVEIVIERVSSKFFPPSFSGIPDISTKWWRWKEDTFEKMCLKDPQKDTEIFDSLCHAV